MASFTCISCRVSFQDAEAQRDHYKTDWHRYNLKRKVAELPPIPVEEFQQKLDSQRMLEAAEKETHSSFCQACNKGFSSQNAYNNHLKSKKHRTEVEKLKEPGAGPHKSGRPRPFKASTAQRAELLAAVGTNENDSDDEWEDIDEEEIIGDEDTVSDEELEDDESLPPNFCLFCPHRSVNVEDNLRHMTRSHSFFIPDIDYLTDVEGLMTYLGAKVGDGKICLFCNEKSRSFTSIEAVRMHMLDKGHCKMAYEGDMALEYSDFYDFSGSYPEDLSTDQTSEELSDRLGTLDIDNETMELVLPSGARAGHRAFKAYYKQSLPPEDIRKSKATASRIGSEYRAIGWHGSMAVELRKKMTAVRKVNMEKRRNDIRLQLKVNKFQPHLRPQVVF